MITIHNIRKGFATNSSSTHSIIIIPENAEIPNHIESDDSKYFGWDFFVLTTPEDKLKYLAAMLYQSMMQFESKYFNSIVIREQIKEWTGVNIGPRGLYVDHQSEYDIGYLEASDHVKNTFFKELADLFRSNRVIVYGGNDNSFRYTEYNPIKNNPGAEYLTFLKAFNNDSSYLHIPNLLKQDGDNYILFNKLTGNKIRFSLKNNTVEPYIKSDTPELVDIKITNYCQYGCKFCYQGSTKMGKHAELHDIKQYIDALSSMQVFELAIGGGEPTEHPDFAEIIEYSYQQNIIPNFTTYGISWLKNNKIVQNVQKYVGGIGVSVHKKSDLTKYYKIINSLLNVRRPGNDITLDEIIKNPTARCFPTSPNIIMVQHVLGSVSVEETYELLLECFSKGIPVLLLGYKNTGFGNGKEYDMSTFPVYFKLLFESANMSPHSRISTVGVDTAFINKFNAILTDLNIPQVLTTSDEGKFSMYIDAVENKISPSSYCDESEYKNVDFQNLKEGILNEYRNW